jgi:transcriptional regulator with XRE-family HTH domain
MQQELLALIAKRIKNLRLQRGLTLHQLSEHSQISKGLLSKIENSRTIPSLPVFLALVNALEVSANQFFEGMTVLSGQNYLLVKRKNYQKLKREERPGFDYRFITGYHLNACSMQAVLLTVKPGAKSKPTTTDGVEFKFILSGSCDYLIQDERLKLEEGDSLLFDASKPHMPVNQTRKPVKMLVLYYLSAK